MASFHKYKLAITSFRESVESLYGKGIMSYAKFIYFGFIRINKFIVMEADVENFQKEKMIDGFIYSNDINILKQFRKDKVLPKQFYIDEIYNVKNVCMVLQNNEIAHIHWIFLNNDESRFLVIGKDHAEINYALTMPKFRRSKLYISALRATIFKLKEYGVTKVFAVPHSQTIASIRVFRSLGFVVVKNIYSFCRVNLRAKTNSL